MSRPAHFDAFARLLHWGMAVLVLAMLFVGVGMVASLTLRPVLLDLHRPVGMALLVLVAIRWRHRRRHPPPPLPADLPRLQAVAAVASHRLLYVLMLAMPLLGWSMLSAGGYPIRLAGALHLPALLPQDPLLYTVLRAAHGAGGYALFALVLLHLAGALYHAWVRRDGVFEAMWRGPARTGDGGAAATEDAPRAP